jgi:hypothetical protein
VGPDGHHPAISLGKIAIRPVRARLGGAGVGPGSPAFYAAGLGRAVFGVSASVLGHPDWRLSRLGRRLPRGAVTAAGAADGRFVWFRTVGFRFFGRPGLRIWLHGRGRL